MPAPTNTSFGTATDVGTSLPVTISQRVDDSGTTYTVWYSYTAQATDTELSVFPLGDLVTYTPQVTFWTDASTQFLSNNAINRPSQIPLTPGVTYGIKISPNGGNPTPANLTLTVTLGPKAQLAARQIAINDSSEGYPVVIMDPTTAAPVAFKHPFASGESVRVLQSGVLCAADITNDRVLVYDQNLNLLVTPTMPSTGYSSCVGTNQKDSFWVGKNGGGAVHAFIALMQPNGTFSTPIDLGSTGLKSLAPNQANSIVYFIKNDTSTNQAVFKVTSPGGVVTTFLSGVAGYSFNTVDLMTMTDDTVLVHYAKSGSASYIEQRNPDGTLAKTFTLAVDAGVQHIFADPDDPAYFWIWTENPANTNTFTRINVSSGATTVVGPWPEFIEGDYQLAASATPTALFGADFSCDPWIIRGTTPTQTFTIRRQRRFLLPSSQDNKFVQIPTIEILGRGNGLTPGAAGSPVQGQDPIIMVRLSKDGGKTWKPERQIHAGLMGNYLARWRLLRATGNYRNAVLEVTVSDPVDWQMVDAMGTPTEGLS